MGRCVMGWKCRGVESGRLGSGGVDGGGVVWWKGDVCRRLVSNRVVGDVVICGVVACRRTEGESGHIVLWGWACGVRICATPLE